MKKIKAIIIEDETQSSISLKADIERYCPEVHVIGDATNVKNGITAINSLMPDLVFLDINLGDGTGFNILENVTYKDFKVIFVTAHDEYALKGFQVSAIDFLLKPIAPADLINAVHKFNHVFKSDQFAQQLSILQQSLNTLKSAEKKIVLRESDTIHFIRTVDIVRCESEGPYTHFHLIDGKHLIISKNLKEYEDMLIDYGFIRTHHSHLINFAKIVRLDKIDGGMLVMENGHQVPIAQRKKEQIMDMLKNL
jgi:two-component system LytT family response regulator